MSKYLGKVGGFIADYAVVDRVGEATYLITDYDNNILFFHSLEDIANTDGNHYFLVEGKVLSHDVIQGHNYTILSECDFTLVDRLENIKGEYYGKIGDKIELNDIKVSFRRSNPIEWKVTGEFSKIKPECEYRMVIEKGQYTFVLPYNSSKKVLLSAQNKYKYNVYAKVIGYAIENGKRATILAPSNVLKKGEVKLGSHYAVLRSLGIERR